MAYSKRLEKFSLFAREELFQNLRSQLMAMSNGASRLRASSAISDRLLALGFEEVLEEASYTWFNRLITLRYFELHKILPNSLRDLWHAPENLLSTCERVAEFLPQLFAEQTSYCDDSDIDFLFQPAGIVEQLLALPDADFAETEVLGWFYQYYNSTRRQALVSAKRPYTKLELPVATQLFTPAWLSKFLVENSLGRFYLEHGGDSRLAEKWHFYRTPSPSQLSPSQASLLSSSLASTSPEILIDLHSLTFLDPCCGSGHLLSCAFRTFYQMYLAAGFTPSTIPEQILTHNLFGLDVDERATQIATIVILLCAYEYDPAIFQKPIARKLHIRAIPESNSLGKTYIESIKEPTTREQARKLFNFFVDAKNFGSLLMPTVEDFSVLRSYLAKDKSVSAIRRHEFLEPMISTYEMLARRYDVVATNPPYLTNAAMNELLRTFVAENFPLTKHDLSASFVLRGLNFLRDKNSYLAVMTPVSWLSTTRFQPLRQQILQNNCINVLIQPYKHAFFDYAAVEICAFVLQNQLNAQIQPSASAPPNSQNHSSNNTQSEFLRITKKGDMNVQAESFLRGDYESFVHDQKTFLRLPDQRIIYWLDDHLLKHFSEDENLATFAELKTGLVTSDNSQFLRRWYEIPPRQFGKKWRPHNKGGEYRKWFGNQEYVINWVKTVAELKKRKRSKARISRPQNLGYNFRPQLSWSAIGDGDFAVRFYDESFSFNTAGPACFPIRESDQKYLLGLLNSCVAREFVAALNPTLNLNPGDLAKLPIIIDEKFRPRVEELVLQNLQLAAADWHSFETSWDFQIHPLVKYPSEVTIKGAFKQWRIEAQTRFDQMRQNECELNQIFVQLYQLENLIDTSVPDDKVSLRLASRRREVKSLLSYFIGWCFERFDLPPKSLNLAQTSSPTQTLGSAQTSNQANLTPKPRRSSKEKLAAKDIILLPKNILPKLKYFLAECYQVETVAENLAYIADALGKEFGESDEATILRYFQENFYADHLREFHGLPIYWQVDSGPKHAFRAWFYCHNYQTKVFTALKRQLTLLTKKQRLAVEQLQAQLDATTAKGNQKWLTAKYKQSELRLLELQEFYQALTDLQNQNLSLDFDAGIFANYQRFQSILSKLSKS